MNKQQFLHKTDVHSWKVSYDVEDLTLSYFQAIPDSHFDMISLKINLGAS